MALHVPKLAADARPPLGFPPSPSWGLSGFGGLLLFAACSLRGRLQRLMASSNDGLITKDNGDQTALLLSFHLFDVGLLFIIGFYFVSNVVLRRKQLFGSRYGSRSEFVKLLISAAPLAWLHVGAPSLDGPSFLVQYALWFWIGLHFLYSDNIPLLQGFGCKWSAPARWPSCTSAERMFAVAVLTTVTCITLYLGVRLVHVPTADLASLGQVYAAALAAIVVPSVILRSTHSFHLHHYLCALFLLPLTAVAALPVSAGHTGTSASPSHPDPVALAVQAFFLATYVDGVATWGMDPILVPKKLSKRHIPDVDVATVLWTHMIPLMGRPGEWLRVLDCLEKLFSGVELMIDQAIDAPAPLTDRIRPNPTADPRIPVLPPAAAPALKSLLQSTGYALLIRSDSIRKDIRMLKQLLGQTAAANGPSTSLRAAAGTGPSPLTARWPEIGEILRQVRHAMDQSPEACVAAVVACLHSVFLAPLAGARELRQQAGLHLHEGGVGISEYRRDHRIGESDSAATVSKPAIPKPAGTACATFCFTAEADDDETVYWRLHEQVRTALDKWENTNARSPSSADASVAGTTISAEIYWQVQWAVCDNLVKLFNDALNNTLPND